MTVRLLPNTTVNNIAVGSGTSLVLPTFPVAVQQGDLVVVGVAGDYDGIGDGGISVSDDIFGIYNNDAGNTDTTLGRQVGIYDNLSNTIGQPTITITWTTARTNRRGYACAFRNSKGTISYTGGVGVALANTAPVEHHATNAIAKGSGILVAIGCMTNIGQAGINWHEISSLQGGLKNDIFEYRDISDIDGDFTIDFRDDGSGACRLVTAMGKYIGDTEALFWQSVSGSRVLNMRGQGPS